MPNDTNNPRVKFFYKELAMYNLSSAQKARIVEYMLDGLEIMSRRQITNTIEDHIDVMGFQSPSPWDD